MSEVNAEAAPLKFYKVVSQPEGEPTFFSDEGVERSYMRQHELSAENETIAKKTVEASNWDVYKAEEAKEEGSALLYEVVSVEEQE